MNILTFTGYPLDPKLGSGKTVLMFSEGLRGAGHSVRVCEPEQYEPLYGLGRGTQFRQAWGSDRLIGKLSVAESFDLLEFYGAEFWIAIRRLSKMRRRPLLVSHTNGLELLLFDRQREYEPRPKSLGGRMRAFIFGQTHERFSKIAFAHADAFMAICELDRKYVVNAGLFPPERTAVVEPGIDAEYLAHTFTAQREHRVAFCGTWIARKGIGAVSAVMREALLRDKNLSFDVYGTGGARDGVLAGFPPEVHPRIEVHPKLSNGDLARSLSRAKVFFFPTQYEGFGIALAEAMACGLAAVTTPTGFGADLRDGEEALIRGFDDLKGMRDAVLSLLGNEAMRRAVAERGWQRVRSLTWARSVERLEAVYRDWVSEHKRRMREG
ncbi:MAG: glycosyltransferase family 4 protein [Deltaproteobacteria bacterium]